MRLNSQMIWKEITLPISVATYDVRQPTVLIES